MLRVLRKLEDSKLVKEVGGDWTGFVPGCDPDRITIEEVVMEVEGSRRAIPDLEPQTNERERALIGEMIAKLNLCSSNALDRMTIGQVVRQLYAPRAPSRIEDFKRS
jgi:DNA-binding IscR family transcriptional regulator